MLGVVAGNAQGAGFDIDAHALEFFAGENGRALQCCQQGQAPQHEVVAVVFGNDAVVVGEFAFHQLGDELHLAKAKARLVVGELQLQRLVAVAQQALQFEHGLARQDDFLLGHFNIQLGAGKGQAVAVSRHQAQRFAFGHEQDAIEVIANVVHGHGKRNLRQQTLERFLRHAEGGAEVGCFLHQRKVFGRQRLQRELALAALEHNLALRGFERHGLVRGHAAQNVDELARAHGGLKAGAIAAERLAGADLDFEIAGEQLQRFALLAQQHIGENGQGLAPLHHPCYGLQGCENLSLGCFEDLHDG